MTKDHFVAPTYLKHFGDASKGGIMRAYRKSGKSFPCHPNDVCHEWDGDLNPLLAKKELLGEYCNIFEPHWNSSIETLLAKTISPQVRCVRLLRQPDGLHANVTAHWPQHLESSSEGVPFLFKKMQELRGGNPALHVIGFVSR
jgi:hypothetical protein